MIHDEDELDPFSNIDDFFLPDVTKYPDTPDGLLAKELNKWVKEEHQKIKEEMIKEEEEDKLTKDGD